MRENRTHGSEGGETGKTTGLSYPYTGKASPLPRLALGTGEAGCRHEYGRVIGGWMAPDDPNASGNEGEDSPPDENEAASSKAPSDSGQDGTGPEADSEVPPSEAGGVDQSEIDALIRGLENYDLEETFPGTSFLGRLL